MENSIRVYENEHGFHPENHMPELGGDRFYTLAAIQIALAALGFEYRRSYASDTGMYWYIFE